MDKQEKGYQGMYITTCDYNSEDVISANKSATKAYQEAQDKGCDDPVILYVPREDEGIFVF